jgi:hypothetical protein
MWESCLSDEQIIGKVNEQETGLPSVVMCCKPGVNLATFDKLKSKYGLREVSDGQRLWLTEKKNATLKR